MPKKPTIKSNRSSDFEKLKDIGLELEAPEDEFSYQPDSGSRADGLIGKQENGIDVDLDAEGRENEVYRTDGELEDPTMPIPGESEWSQKQRLPGDLLANSKDAAPDPLLIDSDKPGRYPVSKKPRDKVGQK